MVDQKPQSSAEPVSSQLPHNVCYFWVTQIWSLSILRIFKPSLPISLFLESLTSLSNKQARCWNRTTGRAVSERSILGVRLTLESCGLEGGSYAARIVTSPVSSLGEAWVRVATAPVRFAWQPFLGAAIGNTKNLSLHLSVKQRVAVQNSSCGITHCKWLCKILEVLTFTSCWENTDLFWGFGS